jgi:hypothetical protein
MKLRLTRRMSKRLLIVFLDIASVPVILLFSLTLPRDQGVGNLTQIEVERLHLDPAHNVDYDTETFFVQVSGKEPHARLWIHGAAYPLTEVSMDISSPLGPPGEFRIYPLSKNLAVPVSESP